MSDAARFRLLPSGFHGDNYLQVVANTLLATADCFIETGSNVGSTLLYVANTHPHLKCLSCEPDREAFACARVNSAGRSNIDIFAGDSQSFFNQELIHQVARQDSRAVFWLDAHCYGFKWPLKDELVFIAHHFRTAWVLIDDCAVPNRTEFAFHAVPGETCDIPTICSALPPGTPYRIWYPAYTEHTSPWHPLTGWSLVALGNALNHADELLAVLPAGHVCEYVPSQETSGEKP